MSNPSLDNGQGACDQIRERLKSLFPEMTFQVVPRNGTRVFRMTLPGTIQIYGQRTKNMRYDRGNYFASFQIAGETYIAADAASGVDALLQSAVADLEAQLRMRDQQCRTCQRHLALALDKTHHAKKSLHKPRLWTPDAERWSNASMVVFKWFVAMRARISVAIVSELLVAMRTL